MHTVSNDDSLCGHNVASPLPKRRGRLQSMYILIKLLLCKMDIFPSLPLSLPPNSLSLSLALHFSVGVLTNDASGFAKRKQMQILRCAVVYILEDKCTFLWVPFFSRPWLKLFSSQDQVGQRIYIIRPQDWLVERGGGVDQIRVSQTDPLL